MGGYEYRHHVADPLATKTVPNPKHASQHGDISSRDELDVVMRDNDDDSDDDRNDDDDIDPDIDALGDTDEEMTLHLKPRDERDEIEEEIADLDEAVPHLSQDYKLIDRLGTGTFSSVYKAIDLGYHTRWDNPPWHDLHPPSSSAHHQSVRLPSDTKAFVAVKRIYVTSNPERIRNEISIMQDCRGCRHVSQLITAFRHEDQVVAIMPYHRNDDFRVRALSESSRFIKPNTLWRRTIIANSQCPALKPISVACFVLFVTSTPEASSIAMSNPPTFSLILAAEQAHSATLASLP